MNALKGLRAASTLGFVGLAILCASAEPPSIPSDAAADNSSAEPLPDVDEARARARLLHETIHATLQIVHHDFYREDEGLPIPATTLDRVFEALAKRKNVKLRWLAVSADAMNVDHKPQDDFEREAVTALKAGAKSHELLEEGRYRHVAPITLTADCLKCHLPTRRSTESRAAALVISIPTQSPIRE